MKRSAKYLLPLCGLLALVLSCQRGMRRRVSTIPGGAAPKDNQGTPYSAEGFRLTVPSHVRVEKAEPADFILYNFSEEGRSVLHAYVGNHPDFLFGRGAAGPESITQLNDLPCKRVRVREKDGASRTEVLIRLPRDYGWPAYIHFWYTTLEREDEAMADAIIASTTPQAKGAYLDPQPDASGPDFPPPRRSAAETIAEMERTLAEMKKQQGMTEEVKEYEAWLALMKDVHRGAQEEHRKALERTPQESRRFLEESLRIDELLIADMERDLEEMRKQQGVTDEIKDYEAMIRSLKEELRLKRKEHCNPREN